MDPDRWQRVRAIFDRAVEAAADRRAELIERECGGDGALRGEVEALLAADAEADTFAARADELRAHAAADWAEWNGALDGQLVGAWRIVREIGRGGMGLVFLVERADGQFEQRAALKLIKRGMDSEAVLARFLRERQILARLAHRNIARLLDGGIAPDGRPYFVMEYVDGGVALPRYCEENARTLEARLRLFFGVCAAVQFAHRQLIVHSDLKPSNVLVGRGGDVKLLDFGIAKLLGERGPGQSAPTIERPLTPAYAAPEQLRGEPITTATDIYALGCLLYELLTGQRPFRLQDEPTLEQLRRMLESTGPVAPSQLRADDAPVPPRRLRGDLDTIVLTALKREPDRRYATADALAEDLKRYLAGAPIAAHRDSALYRARKFVVRHWIAVAATSAGACVLAAAIAVALWQAREKSGEARTSREVAEFLVGLFAASDPTHVRGAAVTAKDLLDQGAAQLDQRRIGDPELRARFLQAIATSYASLGLYDRAQPLAEEALRLRRARHADAGVLAASLDALGGIRAAKADYAGAEPLLREALALRRARFAADDRPVIESLGRLGKLLEDRGDAPAASALFDEALAAAERRYGADAPETARCLDDSATHLVALGRTEDAVPLFRRALAIRERRLGADDPEVAVSLQHLGAHLVELGRYSEARGLIGRALAIRERVYGPAHPLVAETQLDLAAVHEAMHALDAAQPLAEAALATFRANFGDDHRRVAESLNTLAVLHLDRREYADAAALFGDALARFRRGLGATHPDTLGVEDNLAISLYYAGRLGEAEALQRELVAKADGDGGRATAVKNMQNLARTLQRQGRADEALPWANRALEAQRAGGGGRSYGGALALREAALAEQLAGDAAGAEEHFRESLALARELAPAGGFGVFAWTVPYADFLAGAGRCEEALPLLDEAIAELGHVASASPIWAPQAELLRGACRRHGRQPGAGAAMEAARERLRALPSIEADLYPAARRLYERS